MKSRIPLKLDSHCQRIDRITGERKTIFRKGNGPWEA